MNLSASSRQWYQRAPVPSSISSAGPRLRGLGLLSSRDPGVSYRGAGALAATSPAEAPNDGCCAGFDASQPSSCRSSTPRSWERTCPRTLPSLTTGLARLRRRPPGRPDDGLHLAHHHHPCRFCARSRLGLPGPCCPPYGRDSSGRPTLRKLELLATRWVGALGLSVRARPATDFHEARSLLRAP